jgi:hypothetical protein
VRLGAPPPPGAAPGAGLPPVGPSEPWAPAPVGAPGPRAGGARPVVALLVVLLAVGAAAWFLVGRGGGSGGQPARLTMSLPYVAPSGGFRAMLPCAPQTQQQQVQLGPGVQTTVSFAMCSSDPVVMVGEAVVPPNTPGFEPDRALRGAASGVVDVDGVKAEYEEIQHAGLRAADMRVSARGATARVRVVLGGSVSGTTRIVIAMVGAEDGDPKGDFDRLVETLSVTP